MDIKNGHWKWSFYMSTGFPTSKKMIKWTLKMDNNNDHFVWPLVARHPKKDKMYIKNEPF